ncbi:hypothetical protein TBLA_0A00380 [Henningerozyma blattae CBS 6284]|uniref:Probable vacuolar protein sorting-associated protein 16 homolog n=1 Tax=Henningerozyma blattae (strain ATCC 34711 / CBS 6284 / DSM 70876 / NBRC 10599 / NRRL Y-10934 / UCD 77-7) TaxID=1071380 RepID=I2GUN6_HENB6|nr:hypothetical protein TBLA_0A00380 [Tetrapisispora blattae CBS 6284]CCH57838.1 hypothetical protein TBLA_0A00380 [Tetrapisispora blattae CBS 6284]
MSIRNPSFNWEKLNNQFYRLRSINNDFQWPTNTTDFPSYQIYVSTTLVAIYSKLDNHIQILDHHSTPLFNLNTSIFGTVISLQFNHNNENLIIITNDSIHQIKNWTPLEYTSISLPLSLNDSIWDFKKNYFILKESQNIYFYNDIQNSIELIFTNKDQSSLSPNFVLFKKNHWQLNNEKIVLIDNSNDLKTSLKELNLLDKKFTTIKKLKNFPNLNWHNLILSNSTPNNLALFNANLNKLLILDHNYNELSQLNLNKLPNDIIWLNHNTIICSFINDDGGDNDLIKLYSIDNNNSNSINFYLNSNILAWHLEVDGLKIFTSNSIEFLSLVQNYTSNCFKIGSIEHSAILLDSLNILNTNAPKAIENLKIINLNLAILDCINSAKDEFDPFLQKKLLNAASFGKSSLSIKNFDSNLFIKACDIIKLLNQLNNLGIILTYNQFNSIGLENCIKKLIQRNKYYESFLIIKDLNFNSNFLNLNLEKFNHLINLIFKNWSINKIKNSKDLNDDEIFKILNQRLLIIEKNYFKDSNLSSLSMIEIAHAAYLEGRFNLTRNLSLLEKRPEYKIMELLELNDHQLALKESLITQSPQLILSLLLKLSKILSNVQLIKLIMLNISNENIYQYYNKENHEYLFDFYRQIDSFKDLSILIFIDSKKKDQLNVFLSQIKDLYSNSIDKKKYFINDLIKQENLFEYQTNLSSKLNFNFVNLTINETLKKLIELNQNNEINEFIRKFKINEKKFLHLKIQKLIELKNFNQLYQFITSFKKPPINYLIVYNYIKRSGNKLEASKYIKLMGANNGNNNNGKPISYDQMKQMYLDCKNYEELIYLCLKQKDIIGLKDLYKIIPPNQVEIRKLAHDTMALM